jgi:hypothetical protein
VQGVRRGEPRLPGGRRPRRDHRQPASYTDRIVDNTLAFVATITATDELIAAWS